MNAYRAWAKLGQPRLSPTLQAQLFGLFLQGKTSDEIVSLNKGLSLAQVTQARIEGNWDLQRDDYLQDLFKNTRSMLQQTSLESIRFLTDVLSVVHKKYGNAAKRYIQTGNEEDLRGFEVGTLHQYKQVIETLQKLTGQDRKTEEHHSGEVVHRHQVDAVPVVVDAPPRMKATEANAAIRAVLKKVD